MQNAVTNAFVTFEPSAGKDRFVHSQSRSKLPAVGPKVNRIFGASRSARTELVQRPSETSEFVLGKFFNLPSMA